MSRMAKKQNQMVKTKKRPKAKSVAKSGVKSLASGSTAEATHMSDTISIIEPAPLPLEMSPAPEKSLNLEIEKPNILDSGPPVASEPTPVISPEKELSVSQAQIEQKIELLGFLMNQEEYAIPVSQIKEIIRCTEMTLIPGSSPILLGIISLRGVIIPVFKLANKLANLKLKEKETKILEENDRLKRIIIIQTELGNFGLLVDGVTDVIKIKEDEIQPPPSLLNQMGQEMIKGITQFKHRLIILLFIERIVDVIQDEMKAIRKT